MATLPPLPEPTLRLFPDHQREDLVREDGQALLCERLLEDGDSADLRWLVGAMGEAGIAEWLAAQGGRKLSRRSRAFWEIVLGRESGPRSPVAEQLWKDPC